MRVLELKDLKFRWPGDSSDLLDIGLLSLNEGEKLFIQGASGSGKSTLLNLVGGVLSPVSGEINFLEKDLCKVTAAERDQIRGQEFGFIFQSFNLLPYLSPIENVLLSVKFSATRQSRVGSTGAELENEARRLLLSLDFPESKLNQAGSIALSVGQQQRVAAARALIGSPKLIIADEPTSALDADTRDQFLNLLLDECKASRTSVLFVSHDQSLKSHFDQFLRIEELKGAQ